MAEVNDKIKKEMVKIKGEIMRSVREYDQKINAKADQQ
jgi:hypothetical protein